MRERLDRLARGLRRSRRRPRARAGARARDARQREPRSRAERARARVCQGLYRRHARQAAGRCSSAPSTAWFAGLLRNAPVAVLQRLGLPVELRTARRRRRSARALWRPFFEAVAADKNALADYYAVVARARPLADRQGLERGAVDSVSSSLWPMQRDAVLQFQACSIHRSRACRPDRGLAAASRFASVGSTAPPRSAAKRARRRRRRPKPIIDVFGTGEPSGDSLAAALAHLRKNFFVATEDRLNKNLQKFSAAQEAEAELQVLCGAQAQHAAWLYQQRMTRLTRILIAAFADVKRAHGWVDMNDVEQAAQLLLGQSALSGWVQERLDARIAHLLIDEFQDTNPLQWQALYGWLSALHGRAGSAPRVFIVGDPEAEHLPLPPGRAAGVHRCQEVRARRARRRAAELRPHPPQCASRGRAGQRSDAGRAGGRRVRRLPRPHHRARRRRRAAQAAGHRP